MSVHRLRQRSSPISASEKAQDLFQYNAGAVVEYMPHGGVFTVQIADKMLGAHGQGKYRAQIDNLRANGRLVGYFSASSSRYSLENSLICMISSIFVLYLDDTFKLTIYNLKSCKMFV